VSAARWAGDVEISSSRDRPILAKAVTWATAIKSLYEDQQQNRNHHRDAPECGEQARMATADEAAILACVSPRAIYHLIEARELHFVEMPERVVFICLTSLGNLS
jgi:hypothetical protein